MKWIARLLWLAAVAAIVLLCMANAQLVTLNPNPAGVAVVGLAPLTLPLYAVVLASVGVGVVLGIVLDYVFASGTRRDLKAAKREARSLKRENDKMHEALKAADHPDSAGPPVRVT